MHKPQSIKLSVDNPCHQRWDNMQEAGQGRFCSECQKTVIDFTSWSDAALYQFFSKTSGNVCGRFMSTQLNKPINIPHQPHSRLYRLTIALGLTLICTQTPAMLAQNRPPKAQQSVVIGDTISTDSLADFGSIYGSVVDEKKEPMLSATVMVYQNGQLKGGNITDYDGNYVIKPLDPGVYDILVTFVGYDSMMVTKFVVEARKSVRRNFSMQRRIPYSGSYTIVSGMISREYSLTDDNVYVSWESPERTPIAEIYGRITDSYGNLVSYAEVQIYQENTLIAKRLANANGEYDITRLTPGVYDLRIFSRNHEVVTITQVDLPDGKAVKNVVMNQIPNAGLMPEDEE